ncbi:MAG: hypothetical protein P8R54_07955 [Myxococcota bacterium]|nr:hypothetical protein [Myxococcota bacterium]
MFAFLMLAGCGEKTATPQDDAVANSTVEVSISQLPTPTFTRLGNHPSLTHEQPQRTDSTCGYQIDARHLYPLSNQRLSKVDGAGRVSPVVVFKDGKPLSDFATTRDFADQCAGAFTFGRNAVRFSLKDETPEAAVLSGYTLGLSEHFPLPTPDGDAWWAYPGTRIDLGFTDDAGLAGQTIELVVTTVTSQGRVNAVPLLKVGEDKVLMEETDGTLVGRLTFTVPDGAWTASLVTPPDAPYMLLTSVNLHSGDEVRPMLPASMKVGGSLLASTGPSADLLSRVQFTTEPPKLTIPGEFTSVGAFIGRLEAPTLTELSATAVRERIGLSYSPLRIFEDGKPLANPNASCRKVKQFGKGRYCHSHEIVLLSSSDNTDPLSNSRDYTLALSDERQFEGGLWLYPGDIVLGGPSESPPDGATASLVLTALPVTSDSAISLKLSSSGGTLIEHTISGTTLSSGALTMPLHFEDSLSNLELELHVEGHVVLQGAAVNWED